MQELLLLHLVPPEETETPAARPHYNERSGNKKVDRLEKRMALII